MADMVKLAAKRTGSRNAHGETPRKKNFRLRQSVIDRAKALLGTRTETETIEQALELVVFRNQLVHGVEAMRGAMLSSVLDTVQEDTPPPEREV